MANGLTLEECRDQYESISSTNLIIKSTLTSLQSMTDPAPQKSISQTTKTVAQPRNQQHSNVPASAKNREPAKKQNFSVVKRVDKGSSKPRDVVGKESEENELKQVFTRLQHKSASQKMQQHNEMDEINVSTSSSNLKSTLCYIQG